MNKNKKMGAIVISTLLSLTVIGGVTIGQVIRKKKMYDDNNSSITADVANRIDTRKLKKNERDIYLAGGCFWGTEAFMKKINGIKSVDVGYANGNTNDTDYSSIKKTDHAETAHVIYDSNETNLTTILTYYFKTIDPTSLNRQGNDVGRQYRTGIFYSNPKDKGIIEAFLNEEKDKYKKPIVVEVAPIKNYILAEDYHQDYLDKNVNGYCHVNLNLAKVKIHRDELKPLNVETDKDESKKPYKKQSDSELRSKLSSIEYSVTQNADTEPPFRNKYYNNFKKGIYVDVTTGEPLFSSTDKFESGCGWPAFSKPIKDDIIDYKEDNSIGMHRTEVRSHLGDAHLGHVFDDGPRELGGKRYCINSASLKFIPYEEMDEQGYGEYKELVK